MKKIVLLLTVLLLLSAPVFAVNQKKSVAKVGFEVGEILPDFSMTDLNGKTKNLKDFRGKTVMLNFWATWCPPCRAEMPSMETLWNKNKNKDFVILAVSVDREKTSKVADFIKANKYTFPVFHDTNGKLAQMFLIRSIPTTYILDKSGVILSKKMGAEDWSKLEIK